MRILHYSLGIHPYKNGGLSKYVTDLMRHQQLEGHEIFLLQPSKLKIIDKKVKISGYTLIDGIQTFNLINPLPIPIYNGIKKVDIFTREMDIGIYLAFLKKNRPDVIHVHSLMGIHREFFKAAQMLKIKICFTTHDYFGLCPIATLYRMNEICPFSKMGNHCILCNENAHSLMRMVFLQSSLYPMIKKSRLIGFLKKQYYVKSESIKAIAFSNQNNRSAKKVDYSRLEKYYHDIFSKIDCFHFNSSVAENVYKKYMPNITGNRINILHQGIVDHRKIKNYDADGLKILYLSPETKFKGIDLFIHAVERLEADQLNITIDMYNEYHDDAIKRLIVHGKYQQDQLEEIFDSTDVIVVPSVCNETFGFIVCEALSFGVPVIVTKNVGAKDMLYDKITGFIIEPSVDALYDTILKCYKDQSILKQMNENIVNAALDFSFSNHVTRIYKFYMSFYVNNNESRAIS